MSNNIDLNDFADGALSERFNLELQDIIENIMDPNTDATAKRSMRLDITFKPNPNRDVADVVIEAKKKLAPAVPVGTSIVMGADENGQMTGRELKSGMKGQFFIDEDGEYKDDQGNVVDLQKKSK